MAKVIGFSQEVADNQADNKREQQRKRDQRKSSKHVHFAKSSKLDNKPFGALAGLVVSDD